MKSHESFSLRARLASFRYAARGLRAMVASQHNAWIHALATAGAVLLGLVLRIDPSQWAAVVLAIVAVWTAEALNTAFEALCDVASPDFHPLVERAKDVAAAAVLIASIGALVVGLVVFGPELGRLLS